MQAGAAGVVELAAHQAAARRGRMGAAMISLGAIVVAGTAPRTARSLDSLVRQTRALDRVAIVVAPDIDRRVGDWLDATASARGWTLVREPGSHPGRTDERGARGHAPRSGSSSSRPVTRCRPAAAAAFDAAVTSVSEPADFVVGAARLVALGVDDTAQVDAPDDPAALDPAHPALRSIWLEAQRRRRCRRLRLCAGGGRALRPLAATDRERRPGSCACRRPSFALSVDEGEPLPAELDVRRLSATRSAPC